MVFDCSNNNLISLEGAPEIVDGHFSCSNNKIKDLRGCPKSVGEGFYCTANKITSLQYCPEFVGIGRKGGSFMCGLNNLISLQYLPKEIPDKLDCSYNYLLSNVRLSKVSGEISSDKNPYSVTEEVIEAVKALTYEQQMSELEFFGKNDSSAYIMFADILDVLNVDYNSYRKEIKDLVKGNSNYGILGF